MSEAAFTELRSCPSYPGWAADANGEVYRDGNWVPGYMSTHGYVIVQACKKQVKRCWLVADAWYGPKPDDIDGKRVVCRHLNDNKIDDRPENLRWGTHSENMADAGRNGLMARDGHEGVKGSANSNSKLTEEDVLEIRRLWGTGDYTQVEIAKMFAVSRPRISYIVNRKTWSHI